MTRTRRSSSSRLLVCVTSTTILISANQETILTSLSTRADKKAREEMAKKAGGKGPIVTGGIKKSGKK